MLFRHKKAPTRYAESDIYFANERESKTDLPDSDVLKALHSYISDFYSRATVSETTGIWRSFDESALLGFGILVEEAMREILGETGDLVFTEGDERSQHKISHEMTPQSTEGHLPGGLDTQSKSSEGRRAKRRKINLNE